MPKKIRVGIIFGGRSAEHEVSILSARNVVEAIDKDEYEPVLIGVEKSGRWACGEEAKKLLKNEIVYKQGEGAGGKVGFEDCLRDLDVVFPILHGPFGEDGTVQGLLKTVGIPFVGSGVLGSAVGMDKDVMKRLLRDARIPIGKFLAVRKGEDVLYEEVVRQLELPVFIKPANLGSSVGVSKAKDEKSFQAALREAFRYDKKALIEEYIAGREIECAVLGNDTPIASVPGEIVVEGEFYSYEAKYLDENGASLDIPAKIPEETTQAVQDLAIHTFRALECRGLGRVDFFLRENGDILVNEINTMPGFTSASMYPKLFEASGIGYTELIDRLIELAMED